MKYAQQDHPLHGVNLATILNDLVEHYGWEVLADQINVNCFKTNPSIKSSQKFLMKTTWARERVEAFYLYRFMCFPLPTDEQHNLPPRIREVNLERLSESPSQIALGDSEFFDDPVSGPVMPSKQRVAATRATKSKPSQEHPSRRRSEGAANSQSDSHDPWGKWRE